MSSTEQRPESGNRALVFVIVGAVVALIVCFALVWSVNRDGGVEDNASGASGNNCSETVTVAVAPRIEEVVKQGLSAVNVDCVEFSVSSSTDYQVVDGAVLGGTVPDIWVPDGDWNLEKVPVDVIAQSVASTPVVLVARKDVAAPSGWAAAMEAGTVGTPDPLQDSVGAAAILAPRQEAQKQGTDLNAARDFLIPMAQRYGQAAADGRRIPYRFTSAKITKGRYVTATEAEFLNQRSDFPNLHMVVPPSGAPLLRFPVAIRVGAGQEVRDSALELKSWLTSKNGVKALASANFRGPDGKALNDDQLKSTNWLPPIETVNLDEYRLAWNTWSVPSSILAIYDVSESMNAPSAEGTLVDLARNVADVALDIYPRHSRIGSWVFSSEMGTKDAPYRVLTPVRRLGDEVGGETQRALLRDTAAQIQSFVGGQSSLNDSILAGYKQAVKDYDKNYANNLVVFTDGSPDQTSSISEQELVNQLKEVRTSDAPVRIIIIMLGASGDLDMLQKIAEAGGGNAHQATTATDILKVFASEIANRA